MLAQSQRSLYVFYWTIARNSIYYEFTTYERLLVSQSHRLKSKLLEEIQGPKNFFYDPLKLNSKRQRLLHSIQKYKRILRDFVRFRFNFQLVSESWFCGKTADVFRSPLAVLDGNADIPSIPVNNQCQRCAGVDSAQVFYNDM